MKGTARSIAMAAVFVLPVVATLTGCNGRRGVERGAIIGAAAGGVAGGFEAEDILIGGAVGAVAGLALDEFFGRQESELRNSFGSWVQRPLPNAVTINFREEEIFEPGSTRITASGQQRLTRLAGMLQRYDATAVVPVVWADDTALATRRAERMADFLVAQGVREARVGSVGYPTTQPGVASVLMMARVAD